MRTEKTDRYLSMAPFIIPPLFHIDFTPYLAFFAACATDVRCTPDKTARRFCVSLMDSNGL